MQIPKSTYLQCFYFGDLGVSPVAWALLIKLFLTSSYSSSSSLTPFHLSLALCHIYVHASVRNFYECVPLLLSSYWCVNKCVCEFCIHLFRTCVCVVCVHWQQPFNFPRSLKEQTLACLVACRDKDCKYPLLIFETGAVFDVGMIWDHPPRPLAVQTQKRARLGSRHKARGFYCENKRNPVRVI